MRPQVFVRMAVCKRKNQWKRAWHVSRIIGWKKKINEDHNCWSCTKERINERRPYILAKWSCAKERTNEGGRYILVEWSRAYKRNNSTRTIVVGRMMVMHTKKNKWKRTISFFFLFLVLLKETRTRCESKVWSFCFWCYSEELVGKVSPRFPCLTAVESFSSDLLWGITNYWVVAYLEPCQTSMIELFCENNEWP